MFEVFIWRNGVVYRREEVGKCVDREDLLPSVLAYWQLTAVLVVWRSLKADRSSDQSTCA